MRVNERVEKLKRFFHSRNDEAIIDVHNFVNSVAAALKISTFRTHGASYGVSSRERGISRIDGLPFTSATLNRCFELTGSRRTKRDGALVMLARYSASTPRGFEQTGIDVHVPVSYDKEGNSGFQLTTIATEEQRPLLTIAKTTNRREITRVIVTSHSLEGHRLAEVLTRRLRGIASQFKDEKGARLPQPEFELVKGENVNLPEKEKRPLTRRETTQKGRAALAKLPALEQELKALRCEVGYRRAAQESYGKLVRAAMRKGKALKEERDAARLETAQHRVGHEAALAKLAEVKNLAASTKFGSRGKILKKIREIAEK